MIKTGAVIKATEKVRYRSGLQQVQSAEFLNLP